MRRRRTGYERLAFGRLATHVRLEMQYAMQQRRDEARVRTTPRHIQHLITAVASSDVPCSTGPRKSGWPTRRSPSRARRSLEPGCSTRVDRSRIFTTVAAGTSNTLAMSGGCATGIDSRWARVRFDRIPQPWLKDPPSGGRAGS